MTKTYSCEQCQKRAISQHNDYLPAGWISLGTTSSGKFMTVMIGTWLYTPLDYHFCTDECTDQWKKAHDH